MSQRKNWGQIKSLIGNPVGLCGSSANLLPYALEGSDTLWGAGDWVGKYQRYKLRVSSDCDNNQYIAWPHQFESIEAVSICSSNIGVRNMFFEFINNAVGQLDTGCRGGVTLMGDRGEVCSQEAINPGSKKLKILSQRAEAATSKVLLTGYDDDAVWIRTQVDGEWVDGEYLTVSTAGATTTNYFSSLTGVQFTEDRRNGNAYLTEINTADGNAERLIATYQYDEKVPVFRKSILSGVSGSAEDCDEDADCNQNSCCNCIIALARMRFMPFSEDTDFPQITNVGALKAILQYIYKRDNDKSNFMDYFNEAVRLMNIELKQYNGTGAIRTIQFASGEIVGTARNIM